MDDVKTPIRQSMSDAVGQNEIKANMCCPSCLVCLATLTNPMIVAGSCINVDVKQEKVVLSMGKYIGTLREPGCYLLNPMCAEVFDVSTAQVSLNLQQVKVADAKGNPLLLSGVVTYRVVNSMRAALDVANYQQFVITQGLTVMKRVASIYPYEAKEGEHSLKSEAEELRSKLIALLQERVADAGIEVLNFEFNDLAYSPEIAQAMLVRQQAEAVVDARKLIAYGAVEIVRETLIGLDHQGLVLDDSAKERMASNLVVAICTQGGTTMMLNVGADGRV